MERFLVPSLLVLGLGVGVQAGCTVRVGEAEEPIVEVAADTLRLECSQGPVLASRQRFPLPFAIERLLTVGDDLLAVAKAGTLHAYDTRTGTWFPLLGDGKDYDARAETLARLRRDSIDLFHYDAGASPAFVRSIPAAPHDYAIALGKRSVFLHSPGNPGNVLVVERDLGSGETLASFLPVERNLLQLVMSNLDAILSDTGSVRVTAAGFVFIPLIRDPVEIVGPKRGTVVFLAGGSRGTIRTVSQKTIRDERECRTCTVHREVITRQEIHRLYADAVVDGDALWLLRLDPPGGAEGQLVRLPLEGGLPASAHGGGVSSARSWSVRGLHSTARSLTMWRGRVVIADDRALHLFELLPAGGAACSRTSA